jgi:hypothetical protein
MLRDGAVLLDASSEVAPDPDQMSISVDARRRSVRPSRWMLSEVGTRPASAIDDVGRETCSMSVENEYAPAACTFDHTRSSGPAEEDPSKDEIAHAVRTAAVAADVRTRRGFPHRIMSPR